MANGDLMDQVHVIAKAAIHENHHPLLAHHNTTMETLAPELIQEILEHIHAKPDLASFRLVQRSFAELGEEYFFRVIDVKPTYRSLSPLLEISQNVEFARHVRQVTLHLDDFRHSIWIPFIKKLKEEGLDNGTITQKSEVLQKLGAEFADFQTSPDYTGILSTAFRKLPRLEAVQVKERPSRKRGIDPQTAQEMEEHSLLSDYEVNQRVWGSEDGLRAFSALVGAAYFAGTKLVSFRNNADLVVVDPIVVYKRSELVQRAANVFRHCPVLELSLPQADASLLFDLLSPAVQLEKLTLQFDLKAYREPVSAFSKIVESRCVWASLSEVKVRTVCMHRYDGLLEFLQRHHAKLRRLSLWDCKLSTGSWVGFTICAKDTLKLTRLELGLLSDAAKTYSEVELEGMVNYVLNPNCGELPLGLRPT